MCLRNRGSSQVKRSVSAFPVRSEYALNKANSSPVACFIKIKSLDKYSKFVGFLNGNNNYRIKEGTISVTYQRKYPTLRCLGLTMFMFSRSLIKI